MSLLPPPSSSSFLLCFSSASSSSSSSSCCTHTYLIRARALMDQLHHGHGGDMRRPPPALRAVQKPPAKPWRGGSVAPAPAPPKVYRVEPREFRELVQRLTGAPAARRQQQQQVVVAPAQPVAVRAGGEDLYSAAAAAPWCSFPPLGHAASMDAHHGNGALI